MVKANSGVFDKNLQEANILLRIMMAELETDNQRLALSALRATLHALRDRESPVNAAQVGTLLPTLLRGLYYEGWQPTERLGSSEADFAAFLDHIALSLRRNADLLPLEAAKASFATLGRCANAGEIKELLEAGPPEMLQLWLRANRTSPPSQAH